ncbi:maintenance of mitochondrial morphology protein 1 [Coprinopsis marcescibilis]|uniref:Maintenance of mitochondrial morphology protein 1 n=1 Tax=Coprinopsis marcescibilis TaxID=230819 RepID=A0A5C3LBZ7_COPMA|nr:maintenance of mitochondrial morphology protein 1 [Coprinopsis marcescibilis]
MSNNYIFTFQPTFTQGLILGQLSVLILLGTILRYLFLDSSQNPFETTSYHPQFERNLKQAPETHSQSDIDLTESLDWFNVLLQQVANVYRSKLRGDMPGIDGDEIARQRIEAYANTIRPSGFLDQIKVHSVDLGVSAPTLFHARTREPDPNSPDAPQEIEFDAIYTDTLSLSLSTSYVFNYPTPSFARLPISLTISLSQFKSSISLTPPSPASPAPVLTFSISPNFVLDLTTTSLMGSRAKLANIPKLHELIQHQVRRVLGARATWKVVLPGLASVAEVKQEILRTEKDEL